MHIIWHLEGFTSVNCQIKSEEVQELATESKLLVSSLLDQDQFESESRWPLD